MKRGSPDGKVVVFIPDLDVGQEAFGHDGEYLQRPWVQEVSEVPKRGAHVAFYQWQDKKHPQTIPARRPDGTWRWDRPALWIVSSESALYIADLDVYAVNVEYVREPGDRSTLPEVLKAIANALDLPYPYNENETEGK